MHSEYLIAYRDRDAVPHGPLTIASRARGAVTFQHALIVRGQVAGTWKTTRHAGSVLIHAEPLRRLNRVERHALGETVRRYEQFLSAGVTLTIG